METRKRLLNSSVLLGASRLACQLLAFLRNLLLARLLSKEDFGIASIFAAVLTVLELNNRLGFGLQLVQSPQNPSERLQATAHTLQGLSGFISFLLIAAIAPQLARIFGVPDAWPYFALIGGVTLIEGLTHLDPQRVQRDMDFRPGVMIELIPQILVTIAIWPVTQLLPDYRSIVALTLAKSAVTLPLSLMFSQRPYRWAWDPEDARRLLRFGWPLLATSLLVFGGQKADQMLVGASFSLTALASYGLAFSLVSIPWTTFGQIAASLCLPLLSKAQNRSAEFIRIYARSSELSAVWGTTLLLPLIIAGEQLTQALYGSRYSGTGPFIAALGAASALRFLRHAPALAALARGDTVSQLTSNLWRATSLPLAAGCWTAGGEPIHIAWCAIVGELLSFGAGTLRLRRTCGIGLRIHLPALGYLTACLSAGLTIAHLWTSRLGLLGAGGAAIAAATMAFLSAMMLFPHLRAELMITTNLLFRRIWKRENRGSEVVASP